MRPFGVAARRSDSSSLGGQLPAALHARRADRDDVDNCQPGGVRRLSTASTTPIKRRPAHGAGPPPASPAARATHPRSPARSRHRRRAPAPACRRTTHTTWRSRRRPRQPARRRSWRRSPARRRAPPQRCAAARGSGARRRRHPARGDHAATVATRVDGRGPCLAEGYVTQHFAQGVLHARPKETCPKRLASWSSIRALCRETRVLLRGTRPTSRRCLSRHKTSAGVRGSSTPRCARWPSTATAR